SAAFCVCNHGGCFGSCLFLRQVLLLPHVPNDGIKKLVLLLFWFERVEDTDEHLVQVIAPELHRFAGFGAAREIWVLAFWSCGEAATDAFATRSAPHEYTERKIRVFSRFVLRQVAFQSQDALHAVE